MILQRDVRTPPPVERRLQGHRQEVCGLKWSPDHQHLASGGNDNKVRASYKRDDLISRRNEQAHEQEHGPYVCHGAHTREEQEHGDEDINSNNNI